MRVEEVLAPVGAVLAVSYFRVDAHDGGENLGDEEDHQPDAKRGSVALAACLSLLIVSVYQFITVTDVPWLVHPSKQPV